TLLKQKKTKDALPVAEEGRAQALVDLLKLTSESDSIEKKNITIWVLNGNDVQMAHSVERLLQHSSTRMIDTYVNLTEYD
ncbi:unnamed protein product, partial [Pocillopora meandrina]